MAENKMLIAATAGMAVLEAVMIFATEFWVPALVMASIFGLCAWRLMRPGRHRTVLAVVAVAFLLELAPLAFFPRETTGDWVAQGLAGLLSLVGLIAAARGLVVSARQRDMSMA